MKQLFSLYSFAGIFFVALLGTLSLSACGDSSESKTDTTAATPEVTGVKVWLKNCGHSESLFFDGTNFYVSDFGGELTPGKKGGNGLIRKVDINGNILDSNVAKNVRLNRPKGLIKIANKLYVNDIDSLKVIDLSTGTLLAKECIDFTKDVKTVATIKEGDVVKKAGTESYPGINDIVKGADDKTVFVSITNTGNIYRVDLATKKVSKVGNLPYANGLVYHHGVLYANAFSAGKSLAKIEDVDGAKPKQTFMDVKYEAEGGLDGLALYDDWLIFSDWGPKYMAKDSVLAVGTIKTLDMKTGVVADLAFDGSPNRFKGPSDILVVGNTLYVPALGEDKIYSIPLK